MARVERADDRIRVDAMLREKDLVKQVPGSRYDRHEDCWYVPLSWGACQALRGVFGDTIEIGDELRTWAWEWYETKVRPALELRQKITLDRECEPLLPFQDVVVEFGLLAERFLNASDLGLGKTVETIFTLNRNGDAYPALVISPNTVKRVWRREFQKWADALGVDPPRVEVVAGSAKKRADIILDETNDVVVINWENMRGHSRLAPYGSVRLTDKEKEPKELNERHWQTVVADECFTGDTVIDTPSGFKRIDSLREGDIVWGFDHNTNEVIRARILGTMNRETNTLIGNATPNHPVYVNGEGYRLLGDLKSGDKISIRKESNLHLWSYVQPTSIISQDSSSHILLSQLFRQGQRGQVLESNADVRETQTSSSSMRMVQKIILMWQTKAKILLQNVQHSVHRFGYFGQRETSSKPSHGRSYEETRHSGETSSTDERAEQSRSFYEYGRKTSSWAEGLDRDGEKWSSGRHTGAKSPSVEVPKLRSRVLALLQRWGSTFTLFPRHRISTRENRGGSGWWRSSVSFANRVRHAKNDAVGAGRMDSHSVLELRDPQRYRRLCEEGSCTPQRVFTLTTSTGNYFANGVLVKNCHRAKDPRTKQTRALWAVGHTAPYRIALTGTPVGNQPDDLWSIMHFVAPEDWPRKTQFIDRYALTSWGAWGGLEVVGVRPDTREEFYRVLDPRFIRHLKDQVQPQLPPKTYEQRECVMVPKQKRAYEAMREHMLAELESGDVVVATNPLTQMVRLSQFASAYAELDEEGQLKLSEPSCKVDALLETTEELGDQRAVVFAESKQLIKLAERALTRANVTFTSIHGDVGEEDRELAERRFQDGYVKLILLTYGAGGEGITLTAANAAFMLQRSWSYIKNRQAEDRVHRIGLEHPVTIVDFFTADTVDEKRIEKYGEKGEMSEEITRDRETLRWLLQK